MKLITQAQFNISHSAVLKILEFHNWSAAEHIWVISSNGDEVSFSMHHVEVNNERFKAQSVGKETPLEMVAEG